MTEEMRCWRPLIIGRRGAVAANHPLAAQAGLMALRAGGNAVDAAVATALALAVAEPMMSGLGGDAFYHVFDAKTGRAVVLNGTGPAPRAATPERYAARHPAHRAHVGVGSRHARRARHDACRTRHAALGAALRRGDPPGARGVRRDAALPAFRRRACRYPARRPPQRRGIPRGRRGAGCRRPDRAARPCPRAGGNRRRGRRLLLSRRPGPAARRGLRRRRRARSARPISPNSRPSGRRRLRSTTAVLRCWKRRSTRPVSCCSRS